MRQDQTTNNNQTAQQLSEEELQRTQVLNLEDFREVARIERLGSKKPAIFVAVIGILSIILGTTFPMIQSYNARRLAEKKEAIVEARKVPIDDGPKKDILVCKISKIKQPDGSDEFITSTYTFEDEKLLTQEKDFQLIKSDISAPETAIFKIFRDALPPYLAQQNGYSVKVGSVDNGIRVITDIDYTIVNLEAIPVINKENYRFNAEFPKDASLEEVRKAKIAAKYICEYK